MSGAPRWEVEGRDWPNREASSFIETPGLRWHVQRMGRGPIILLLHGTGSATHSWRDVMPALAEDFTVIVPDLPGHGFTRGRHPSGMGLGGMASALDALLGALGAKPVLIGGHSAGAAIALHRAIAKGDQTPVIGFNPAIMPFPGAAARIFPAMAKLLFVNPLAPRIFARLARVPGETARFLRRSTGSSIDAVGLRCYEALLGNVRHCEGALAMMASWDLETLARDLPRFSGPVLLVHSRGDVAVPLSSVEAATRLLSQGELEVVERLGHLAHEEDPQAAAARIRAFAGACSILPSTEVAL